MKKACPIPNAYVLHCKTLAERRSHMETSLSRINLECEWITDHDAVELSNEKIQSCYSRNDEEVFRRVVPLWGVENYRPRDLTKGEISLAIKHVVALEKASSSSAPYTAVFEDDCIFCEDFNFHFDNYMKTTPADWDVIHVGDGFGMKPERYKKSFNGKSFLMNHPASRCTEAILFKREAAKKIVSTILPFHLAADWELAYQYSLHSLNVYWWDPAPITQASHRNLFKSSLR